MIIIVDYDAGNIGSIKNMLLRLGYNPIISNKTEDIEKASHLVLPGVGSFDYGMRKLNELGIIEILKEKVLKEKTPILGICLGAQLMCNKSEEGELKGLGWINGCVKKFPTYNYEKKFFVPFIGWDRPVIEKESKLLDNLLDNRFYFVHSYYMECFVETDILSSNQYSVKFHSSFEKTNILGVQFHPEKSHSFGKRLLKNFIENYF